MPERDCHVPHPAQFIWLIAPYQIWGNRTATSGEAIAPYGYTGREPTSAGIGLMFYRARYYDPSMGRFISRDPAGMPDGINRYAYVRNDPINLVDPDGELAFFWHAGITYLAARDLGKGFVDSLVLAWTTMMVDMGTQSTVAADANKHAMLGTIGKDAYGNNIYQTASAGLQAINGIIANAPLPIALHTSQDAVTPDHYLKPWEGGGFDLETVMHLLHDIFPSTGTISNAYNNTLEVLSNRIDAAPTQQNLQTITDIATQAPFFSDANVYYNPRMLK